MVVLREAEAFMGEKGALDWEEQASLSLFPSQDMMDHLGERNIRQFIHKVEGQGGSCIVSVPLLFCSSVSCWLPSPYHTVSVPLFSARCLCPLCAGFTAPSLGLCVPGVPTTDGI